MYGGIVIMYIYTMKALGLIIKGLIFELFLVISQGPIISTDEKLDFRTDCYTCTNIILERDYKGFACYTVHLISQ